jgi:hypothetical protein
MSPGRPREFDDVTCCNIEDVLGALEDVTSQFAPSAIVTQAQQMKVPRIRIPLHQSSMM